MKLKIGVTKIKGKSKNESINDNENLGTINIDKNVTKDELINILTNICKDIPKKISPTKEDDIIVVLTDMGDAMGGCSVSGRTYIETRTLILKMVYNQLARQILATIKKGE